MPSQLCVFPLNNDSKCLGKFKGSWNIYSAAFANFILTWITAKSTKLPFQVLWLHIQSSYLIVSPSYHGSLAIFHLLKSKLKNFSPSNVIIILKSKVTANNRNNKQPSLYFGLSSASLSWWFHIVAFSMVSLSCLFLPSDDFTNIFCPRSHSFVTQWGTTTYFQN